MKAVASQRKWLPTVLQPSLISMKTITASHTVPETEEEKVLVAAGDGGDGGLKAESYGDECGEVILS